MSNINLYHADCMEFMRSVPDKHYELAIVDPPYGIGASMGVGLHSRKKFEKLGKKWDDQTPQAQYWDNVFRVSKNQIVCGANYFNEYLPSTKSFVCWVKNNPAPNFAEAEYIWTSFDVNGKVYDTKKQIQHQIMWEGGSIHPTQKPVALYKWLLKNYAKEGDKILDTHGGSMSIAIACHDMGFDLDLCELDEDYYKAGVKRFEQHKAQLTMF